MLLRVQSKTACAWSGGLQRLRRQSHSVHVVFLQLGNSVRKIGSIPAVKVVFLRALRNRTKLIISIGFS